METARWDHIASLFEQARALGPNDRNAFLDQLGRDDPDLRRQLDALLEAHEEAHGFFDNLAEAVFNPPPPDASPPVQRMAHYEVLEKLGGGGMGVVYKARDTRLDRFVALKFLPPHFSADEAAKERFMHEARAASALDHVNICTIHEIGQSDDGRLFIAMAYYEGETLKKKIERGPLVVEEAVDYAAQMARGLERAHEQGIVHRDVKPANVMVTRRGGVKLVDFGLAKMADVQLTRTGTTLGTVAYMSPEQTRGERVDHRSDVWSLGVVLYEMLTGERPFKGDHEQAIIYSILYEEPVPVTALRPEVQSGLWHVVSMSLAKDVEQRYQKAADLLADLEALAQRTAPAGGAALHATTQRRRQTVQRGLRRGLLAGAGLLAALALLLAIPSVRQAVLPGSALPAQRHLAVLPFTGAAANADDQAFADGLAETLRSQLARLEPSQASLWVVPTQDMYKKDSVVATAAGAWQFFAANLAVAGRLERQEGRIRLELTLLDTQTLRTLRAAAVEGREADLPAFQRDVLDRAVALLDLDLPLETRRLLTQAGATAPGAYDFYLRGRGYLQRYQQAGQIEAAITVFQRALQEDPTYAPAFAGLAQAYQRKYWDTNDRQWVDKAGQYAEQALQYDDDLAEAYVTLGSVHRVRGGYGSAKVMLDEALARDPANSDAYLELAKTAEDQGDFDTAEATYQRAIALKPDYWVGYNDLGIFYHNRARHQEAIEQFQRVVELAPDNHLGYNNVGTQYSIMNRPAQAAEWYERSLTVQPNYSAYRHLGILYYREHRFAEAAAMYEKALTFRDIYYVWEPLARAYYWAGARQKAQQAWRRAVEDAEAQLAVNPRKIEAMQYLIDAYPHLGQPAKALDLVETVLALDRKDPQVLDSIARLYELLGQRDLALRYLQEALENGLTTVSIERSPWLEALRADPRYQDLVRPYLEAPVEDAR